MMKLENDQLVPDLARMHAGGTLHLTGNQYGVLECTAYYCAANIASKTAIAWQSKDIHVGVTVFEQNKKKIVLIVTEN